MKKLAFFLLFFLLILTLPKQTLAYQQTDAICYSQCAAYKFGWKGDFCWDLFTSQCSMSSKDTVNKMISLVKDAAKAMATGKLMTIVDVSAVFKGWFVCKPLIEDCIVPQLQACESTCKDIGQTYYAPNLSVGNPYGSISYQNVYYDEDRHQLTFKVTNNGGYAWDIDVTASWGHTRNRDKMVSGGGTLFTEKIPELVFFGARVGSPKSPGDYVTDFLINESNFSGFLKKYKSDANNHYIPPAWYKTIPFTAPDGEYTRVIFNVDSNQMIPESSEGDNTYILEIDKLPTPASFSVENLTFRRTNPTNLTEYMVSFELKNRGEENGNAHITWWSGGGKVYEQEVTVQGLNKISFDHILNVDVTEGGDSCNYSQRYISVVVDDDGFIKTSHEFSIPLFAGSISGRVEDLFGKKVVGATVTASTGQKATVDKYGYYHIQGIPTLGKVTVTVTHPDFSQVETKEVEIKFDDSKDKCHIEGLTQSGVNFILKDQDVIFTATLKDTTGKPVNGHILVSSKIANSNFRLEQNINGMGELTALQPGEYMFTISAGGYKTIAQTVSAVPNNQNLIFILEPLAGRSNDGSIVIQAPQLLWQMDRGSEILSKVTATKDGKRVMLYTTKNKPNTGKLYFLDAMNGNKVEVVNTPATGGNSKACLGTSYDGNTTALLVRNGKKGVGKGIMGSFILFNNQGNEFAETDYPCLASSGCSANECSVSPDGFYIYPGFLINKSLYAYSRMEIMGVSSYPHMGYTPPVYFLHGNGLIAGCEGRDGGGNQCAMTIAQNELTRYNGVPSRVIDSSFNDQRVIFGSYDKLFLFGGGSKTFEKDVNASGREPSASISQGGQYIIYTHNEPKVHNADFKIVTYNNVEKTPVDNLNVNEDVIFVHANDKGLFFLTSRNKILKYYQVGKYTTEYNTPTSIPTAKPETTTSDVSVYFDGHYFPARSDLSFANMTDGVIYIANHSINLDMGGSMGSLNILEGTIFSIDANRRPILLKGQMTADFSSPAIIYAIKFDRFDMNLFQTKLNQFRSGTLPTSEYFVVKNIHTKFTLKNYANSFNVAVDNGQVNVLAGKTEKFINSGKQISIDSSNNIKESIYINFKISLIIIGVLILIFMIVLFIYRKTKVGKKIIEILKISGILIFKYFKIFIKWLWLMIKKVARNIIHQPVKKKP